MIKHYFIFACLIFLSVQGFCQVDLAVMETAYTQDFNSLSETPNNTLIAPAVLPSDWLVYNNGANSYRTSDGSSTTASIYSYGNINDVERSLGSLRSTNGPLFYFGASFQNNTGADIYYLKISFTVEQWRQVNSLNDSLVLEFSSDASSLNIGSYSTIDLGSVSSIQSGLAGLLDGNLANNQLPVSLIYPCAIGSGDIFFLRWRDDANLGSNAGLAVDDFSITPYQSVHYYDNNALYTDLYSWGTNTDGSGAVPSSFTDINQYFHFRNNAVTLNQPWNLYNGIDTNVIVNETTTLILEDDNIIANFILNANSEIAIEGTDNFVVQNADVSSVINFNWGNANPSLIKFNTCGILNLNIGPYDFRFDTDLTIKNTLEVFNYIYVPEAIKVIGTVNVSAGGEVECEHHNSIDFNSLDFNSTITYSGPGSPFDDSDTIFNNNYGILKVKGVRNHVLGEDVNVSNRVEVTERNTGNANGALDFSNFQLVGPGDFIAGNDGVLLVRDSMGVQGSILMTGDIHILEEVSIGYIGNNLKYSGNPYLDSNRLQFIGTSGPRDLIITEDFSVSEGVQPYVGNINLNGHIIYLDSTAFLVENTGYTVLGDSGYVEFVKTFSTVVANPGEMGLEITSTQNLGRTVIRRGHAIQTGGSNESIRRYFEIHPTNNTALDATLRMYYVDNAYLRNGLDETTFQFSRSIDSGQTWTDQMASVTNPALNYVELSNIPSFSTWTISSSDAPLPVQLVKFYAVKGNNKILIHWQTASEKDCSHFNLLKSNDGINYFLKSTIIGNGTTTSFNEYTVPETEVNSETMYYKLVQVDFNGRETIYNSIVVKGEVADTYLKYDERSSAIQIRISENYQAFLYNSAGQLIKKLTWGTHSCVDLPMGIYVVIYGTERLKFFKSDLY